MSSVWNGEWPFAGLMPKECSIAYPFPSAGIREKLNRSPGFEVLTCEKDGTPVTTGNWCILVVLQSGDHSTGFAYARWGIVANAVQDFFDTDGSVFGANDETVVPAKVTLDARGVWKPVTKGVVKC